MIRLTWGQKSKTEPPQKLSPQNAFSYRNVINNSTVINLDRLQERRLWSDRSPTQYALDICRALKTGKLDEYWAWLEQRPGKKIIKIFLGIIYSESAGLPVLYDEEIPPVIIDGTAFDPVQNVQARMMTKISLLLIVKNESQKLNIWDQIQSRWTAKYILETKAYIRLLEAVIQQCENTSYQDRVPALRQSIDLIKESNRQYQINW
jgi:hypothetical protein